MSITIGLTNAANAFAEFYPLGIKGSKGRKNGRRYI